MENQTNQSPASQDIPSHLKMALESIPCFTDDGKLSVEEMDKLLAIAEEDGKIDSDEARVLSSILKKALTGTVDPATTARIQVISEIIMRR